ncbi:Transmembrane protein 33, partial [Schistosoma japonicum]
CLSYLVALWFNQTSISFKCQSLHIGKAILARFLLCTGKFAMSTVNGSSGDVRQRNSFISHLKSNYVNTAMYFARLGTLFCCIMFFFAPLFSHLHPSDLEVWYRRALLASAATSALRLHQRIKSLNTGFSREVLEVLITEDSSHYLLFSIMFAILPPNNGATRDGSDVLTPTSNSSFLHQTLQKLVNSVKAHDQNILRIIALNEIMLMVVCIFMALSGPRIFVLPFIYYPFLKMRYNSKRNPYTRNAFMEVRIALQNVAYHSKCPAFISRVIYGLINIVSRLDRPLVQAVVSPSCQLTSHR